MPKGNKRPMQHRYQTVGANNNTAFECDVISTQELFQKIYKFRGQIEIFKKYRRGY